MRRTWVPRKMAECHAIKLPAEAHINKEQIQAVARHPHAHITSTIASYNREALAVTGLYEARHDISDTAKLVQGLYERKGKTGSRSARYTAPRLTRSSPGRVPDSVIAAFGRYSIYVSERFAAPGRHIGRSPVSRRCTLVLSTSGQQRKGSAVAPRLKVMATAQHASLYTAEPEKPCDE